MNALKIPNRPARAREWVETLLRNYGVSPEKPALVGCRGYFRDSMGDVGENDRGIYDDAVFLISPSTFTAFNFNTDPTAEFKRGLATLQAGKVWQYKLGVHGITTKPVSQQYMALVQAAPVTVIRDGKGPDTGWFGINIHRGGNTTTSSLGCQTVPPRQWEEFFAAVQGQMQRAGVSVIPYLLIEQQG
jgi:lysozyme